MGVPSKCGAPWAPRNGSRGGVAAMSEGVGGSGSADEGDDGAGSGFDSSEGIVVREEVSDEREGADSV